MKFPTKYLPVKRRKAGKRHKKYSKQTSFSPFPTDFSGAQGEKGTFFPSVLSHWKRVQVLLSATRSQLNTRQVKKQK